MSNFILNEGYQQNKENLFNKGKEDLIFIDKKKYIDLSFCAGANLLGHNTSINKKILRKYLKKNISNFAAPNIYAYNYAKTLKYLLPQFSKFIFCNSGSEAIVKTIRICRSLNNKKKIINVSGSWHGSVDQFLFTKNILKQKPLSAGLPREIQKDLVTIPYNEFDESLSLLNKYKKNICCIIIEPIQGCLPTYKSLKYLKMLEKFSKKNKITLVFDEMITGLRTGGSSLQNNYKIKTDISTFGKAFGGGLPMGIIGLTKNIEKKLKKNKLPVYFGGTYSGNSLCTFFGNEYLQYVIKNKKKIFKNLENKSIDFYNQINSFINENNLGLSIFRFHSMIRIIFSKNKIVNRYQRDFFEKKNLNKIKMFKNFLYLNKIYYPSNGIIFLSNSSKKKNIEYVIKKIEEGFIKYFK